MEVPFPSGLPVKNEIISTYIKQCTSTAQHFGKNTAHRPHINGWPILWAAPQQLRCPIPATGHLRRVTHLPSICGAVAARLLVQLEQSRQPKVGDFQAIRFVDQQIGRFDILH